MKFIQGIQVSKKPFFKCLRNMIFQKHDCEKYHLIFCN
jgi:hypothetical protein